MDYYEIKIDTKNLPETLPEIILAWLSEIGYDSFNSENGFLNAYIPSNLFSEPKLEKLLAPYFVDYTHQLIKWQNWNAKWESDYPLAIIDNKLVVRAPFHKNVENKQFEIIISPKMSFGTGHHETTSLMCSLIMSNNFKNHSVLDMGAGTGILGILCNKMGAGEILCIDNDIAVFENLQENILINQSQNIKVLSGNKEAIPNQIFDEILANINKNVLINDIAKYSEHLSIGGKLLLSGFYLDDIEEIKAQAIQSSLKFVTYLTKNQWAACIFEKSE